jgi:hypothetical protein
VGLGPNSYGPPFNANGGGWYAIERTNTYIKVWFWGRNDMSVPSDVSKPGSTVNTRYWGTPSANFPNTSCDFASEFDANNIIINLTFCSLAFFFFVYSAILINYSAGGDWAGNQYGASGCPSTCVGVYSSPPANARLLMILL